MPPKPNHNRFSVRRTKSPEECLATLASHLVHHGVPHAVSMVAAQALQQVGYSPRTLLGNLHMLREPAAEAVLNRFRPSEKQSGPFRRHSYRAPEEPRRRRYADEPKLKGDSVDAILRSHARELAERMRVWNGLPAEMPRPPRVR